MSTSEVPQTTDADIGWAVLTKLRDSCSDEDTFVGIRRELERDEDTVRELLEDLGRAARLYVSGAGWQEKWREFQEKESARRQALLKPLPMPTGPMIYATQENAAEVIRDAPDGAVILLREGHYGDRT